jgi:hypothetical protein
LRTNFFGSLEQGAARRALVPRETAAGVATDPALVDAIVPPGNDVRRHGIEQFVGHHGAGERLRQGIQPFDPGEQVRGGRGDMSAAGAGAGRLTDRE